MRLRLAACALVIASPLAAEWEAGAYLGAAHTAATTLTIDQASLGNHFRLSPVRYDGRPFTAPPYYGYRASRFFNGWFGIEAELIHLKVFAETARRATVSGTVDGAVASENVPMNSLVGRFSISHGVNLLLGNSVVRHRLGRLTLQARAGAGGTIPHAESEILGHPDEHYQRGSPAWQLAAGPEFRLWHGLHALAEYKYTRTSQHVRVFAGSATTMLRSHHVVFGLAYHF